MVFEFQAKASGIGGNDGQRGINVAHSTIQRWAQHYTLGFVKRWNRFARKVGGSWRLDETYIGRGKDSFQKPIDLTPWRRPVLPGFPSMQEQMMPVARKLWQPILVWIPACPALSVPAYAKATGINHALHLQRTHGRH